MTRLDTDMLRALDAIYGTPACSTCECSPCECRECIVCKKREHRDTRARCEWCCEWTCEECMTKAHNGEPICQPCYDEEYADEINAEYWAESRMQHERDMR